MGTQLRRLLATVGQVADEATVRREVARAGGIPAEWAEMGATLAASEATPTRPAIKA